MAIIVIKQGISNTYKVSCPVCNCAFEFDTPDAKWSQEIVNTGSTFFNKANNPETALYCSITCPCCYTSIRRRQSYLKRK